MKRRWLQLTDDLLNSLELLNLSDRRSVPAKLRRELEKVAEHLDHPVPPPESPAAAHDWLCGLQANWMAPPLRERKPGLRTRLRAV